MMKSRTIRRARHIACMERKVMHIGFWRESQKERDPWEDLDVVRRIILMWILER
jgi:hypothetical protein